MNGLGHHRRLEVRGQLYSGIRCWRDSEFHQIFPCYSRTKDFGVLRSVHVKICTIRLNRGTAFFSWLLTTALCSGSLVCSDTLNLRTPGCVSVSTIKSLKQLFLPMETASFILRWRRLSSDSALGRASDASGYEFGPSPWSWNICRTIVDYIQSLISNALHHMGIL